MEEESGISNDNIKVIVRIRPLNDKEKTMNGGICASTVNSDSNTLVMDSKPTPKTFSYDWVGDHSTPQVQIFNKIGKSMADTCLEGYNCTIFAYGQTGAGKTYTMQGNDVDFIGNSDNEHKGLQPRVFEYLFHKAREEMQKGTLYLIKCSHVEIYNEQILDLLDPSKGVLQLREDFKRGVFIDSITEEIASNSSEALDILRRGTTNRRVASTDMNKESSRSHSVFTLTIESKVNKNGIINVITSKFNFVDLAGSERQKLTSAIGVRLKEAGNINKSLTVLGSVINSLVEESSGKKTHVRYRDSKLTFLLKDSLGGNSKTTIIANVSPYSGSFGETLSTLKFASRAKMIKNKASINQESTGCVEALKRELSKLQELLKIKDDELRKNKLDSPPRGDPEHKDSQLQKIGCISWQEDPVKARDEIITQNQQQLDLELLLKDCMEMINESEQRLEQEYTKKQEFMKLFKQACSMYETKENQMKLMINLYEDKIQRVKCGQSFTPDQEIKAIMDKNQTLMMVMQSTPQIMQVYKNNLMLKHQLEYSEDPKNKTQNVSLSFSKIFGILNRNFEKMEALNAKLSQSIEQRKLMNKRFDMICHWTGISSEQIQKIEEDNQVKGLEAIVEKLNLELLETKQREGDLSRDIEYTKKKAYQFESDIAKMTSDHSEQLEKYENRIRELKKDYESVGNENFNNSAQLIEIRDQLQALTVQRDDLLKRTDRAEKGLQEERVDRTRFEDQLYEKIKELGTAKNLLEQKNTNKSKQLKDFESQIEKLKLESKTLNEKMSLQNKEKIEMKAKVEESELKLKAYNQKEELLITDYESKVEALTDQIEKLQEKIEELESERQNTQEEIETINESLEFARNKLEEKTLECEELKKANEEMASVVKEKSEQLLELESEITKHTESNSPHNVAIKENFHLRNLVRDLTQQVEVIKGEKIEMQETLNKANVRFGEYKQREKFFETNIKDLHYENNKSTKEISTLNELLNQRQKEIIDMNSALNVSQDENNKLRKQIEVFHKTMQVNQKQFNELKDILQTREHQIDNLNEEIKKKISALHKVSDKVNVAELKAITLKQEMQDLSLIKERELNRLKEALVTISSQNKQMLQEKISRDQQSGRVNDAASKLDGNLKRIDGILNYLENLVSSTKDKPNSVKWSGEINNIFEIFKLEIQKKSITDYEDQTKMSLALREKDNHISELKRQSLGLHSQCESILSSYTQDLQTLKNHHQRLEHYFKITMESFQLRETEIEMMKDETRLQMVKTDQLTAMLEDLKVEEKKVKSQLLNGNRLIEKLTLDNMTIRTELDILNKVYEGYVEENSGSIDEVIQNQKKIIDERGEHIRELNKEIFSLKTSLRDIEEQKQVVLKGSDLSVEKLLIALERIHREIMGSRYVPNKLTNSVKSTDDLSNLVLQIEDQVKKIHQKEKVLQIKQYEYESQNLRFKTLEKEISLLKKQQQLLQGPFNVAGLSYINPEEIIEIARSTELAEDVNHPAQPEKKQFSSSKKLKQMMKENIQSGKIQVSMKPELTIVAKNPYADQQFLGKRAMLCSNSKESRNILGDKSDRTNHGNEFASSARKMEFTPTSKAVKKLKVADPLNSLRMTYEGVQDQDFDPDNYDFEASTPKKKLQFAD